MKRKIFLGLALGLVVLSVSAAAGPAEFSKGSFYLTPQVGINTWTIPFGVNAEYAITPNIGLGATVMLWLWGEPGWSESVIAPAFEAAYHFTKLNARKLDLYAGAGLGFAAYSWKWKAGGGGAGGTGSWAYSCSRSSPSDIIFLGRSPGISSSAGSWAPGARSVERSGSRSTSRNNARSKYFGSASLCLGPPGLRLPKAARSRPGQPFKLCGVFPIGWFYTRKERSREKKSSPHVPRFNRDMSLRHGSAGKPGSDSEITDSK